MWCNVIQFMKLIEVFKLQVEIFCYQILLVNAHVISASCVYMYNL